MTQVKAFKGYFFDLDGTLVDSKLDFDQMREAIGIPNGEPILEYLEKHPDPEFIKRGHELVRHFELIGAQAATWIPGARELLEKLNKANIPVAILTRNSREVTQLTVDSLDIPISYFLTRDDCLPKPHPEGLHLLAKYFSLSANNTVYIGDYLFDLQTAKAAGVTAALYTGGTSSPYANDADLVIDCFIEWTQSLIID
jgi:HAD superfamily hydrolase (TIGR01509 family)